ncbi:MAG: DUF4914 family protein [Actinobacteria bacterium]|nr:DUF4914 family protein [Actinomycetota bacterium]MCG2789634.1 DUF4914 family protein [Actinomycetes bacterium]
MEWTNWDIPAEVKEILNKSPNVSVLKDRKEIINLALKNKENKTFVVGYNTKDNSSVAEATVTKCKNGLVINYLEKYMRRRDPDCTVIGDNKDTDKVKFKELFSKDFDEVRVETFEWLKKQELAVLPIKVGGDLTGYYGLLIAPDNAGFFVGGLADLQGIANLEKLKTIFKPVTIIYLAPPFRHTHFGGKQLVVHNRRDDVHEIFSYNLYPGPSAKKGIFGVLLQIGENENWLTLHGSTVKVETPYENITTIFHEGASGGGKSEMLEYPHREHDGRLLIGTNEVTEQKILLRLTQGCFLRPVTDDMALSLPSFQKTNKKLVVSDAEQAWFIRLNHINKYGTDPNLESICIEPREPLIFLNLYAVPDSTCLIWEHTEDEPGKPCPNPRVIIPRKFIPNTIDGPVEIDYRSFGIRAPLCTRENPTYGIIGIFHVLPPAIAWLWRLVAPRGDANPSITETYDLVSEGVGSYWPFATGKYVNHANLLLRQIIDTPDTRYLLFPNQYVGVWKVGFMPQWISREFIARRGAAKFNPEHLEPARFPLLGFVPSMMQLEGESIPEYFIKVEKQPEVGEKAYDKGAKILNIFFKKEITKFLSQDIDPLGEAIINCCLKDGSLKEYLNLIPMRW